MDKTKFNNNQKAFLTKVALEVNNLLKESFDNVEIEIDKLRDELPPECESQIDNMINLVYHQSNELITNIREGILNINAED